MPRSRRFLMAVVAVSLASTQAFAKGGNMRSEDRYDPQHIDGLPSDVRQQVLQRCPAARASHDFASFTDHLQKVVLHYERLYCGAETFCGPSGCLHQVYVSSGGHYRLRDSYFAPEGK
jgi:hypothetical protein